MMPEPVGYVGAHARVYRARGPAARHRCACGEPAREWAYNHADPCPAELVSSRGQRYSANPERYLPMCARCHRLFDRVHKTHCPHGHQYADDNLIVDNGKRKCRTCVYARNRKRKPTPEQQARRLELQRIRRAAARREAA